MAKFITLTLLGFLSFTIMDFLIQHLVSSYPIIQITWINSFAAFMAALLFFPLVFGRKAITIKNIWVHLVRGVIIIGMDLSAFYSYRDNSMSAAYSLILTAPIFASLFSVVFEGVKFSWTMWSCTFCAFVGVIIVLNPSYNNNSFTLIFALLSAILDGVTIIIYRLKGQDEFSSSFVLTSNFVVCLGLLPFFLLNFTPMEYSDVGLNLVSGFFLAIAVGLVLYVLKLREVILVGTLQYSQILWAIVINYLLYRAFPQPHVLLGCFMITIASIILIYILPKKSPVAVASTANVISDEHS